MTRLLCSINYIIKNNENMANNAYFTSRSEIIEWINDLVITNLTKIQQLGSGNIYCQLLDAAFPHHVALNKVKWHAYLQVDFLHNFKILQTSFQQLGINKIFDVLFPRCRPKNWQRLSIKTIYSLCNGSSGSSVSESNRMESIMHLREEATRRLICSLQTQKTLI